MKKLEAEKEKVKQLTADLNNAIRDKKCLRYCSTQQGVKRKLDEALEGKLIVDREQYEKKMKLAEKWREYAVKMHTKLLQHSDKQDVFELINDFASTEPEF